MISEGVLLPSEDHQEAINLLRKGSLSVDAIGEEVAEKKQRYEDGMNKAAESVKEELCVRGHSTSDIKKGFAEWLRFAPQYWQDWGELFPRPGIDYTILPHVKAHLGFLFVKVYQTMNQKKNSQSIRPV